MPTDLTPDQLSLRAKIAANERHGNHAEADAFRQQLDDSKDARAVAAALARITRQSQGLPPQVEAADVLEKVAALLRAGNRDEAQAA